MSSVTFLEKLLFERHSERFGMVSSGEYLAYRVEELPMELVPPAPEEGRLMQGARVMGRAAVAVGRPLGSALAMAMQDQQVRDFVMRRLLRRM